MRIKYVIFETLILKSNAIPRGARRLDFAVNAIWGRPPHASRPRGSVDPIAHTQKPIDPDVGRHSGHTPLIAHVAIPKSSENSTRPADAASMGCELLG